MKPVTLVMALLGASLGAPATHAQGGAPSLGEPGGPGRVLSPAEFTQWIRGRKLFDQPMHRSRGLGLPNMNADSCRGCHQDPAVGGAGGLELNVSRAAFDNGGAGPYADIPGGQAFSKLYPSYVPGREEYDPLQADVFEQRQTPSLLGSGLIDSISDAEILAHEDPGDVDMDGVRGVARIVPVGAGSEVGRFGWKAQIPHLEDFVRDAMGGELGMTTPDDGRGFAFVSDGDPVADPEISEPEVDDVAFFLQELGPPLRTFSSDPDVLLGEALFSSIGCAKCHRPTLMGTAGPVPLYSDLLLHDVSKPSFRGMSEPGADVGFYRTPPLWGIGDTAPYMHDGSAETLAAAILAHFGEGNSARFGYLGLPVPNQAALIAFLNDL